MSLYPDLDDMAANSPVAVKELAELRARVKELEEAHERAGRELIAWRAAIQRITPGGSEFMDPASVEAWAQKQNRELADAKMKAAMAGRALRGEEGQ